jgi:glycosylphosphatidylinositol phospholipase D
MLAATAAMALGLAAHTPFCAAQGFPATIELSSLDGTHGFALKGVSGGDWTGSSVSDAGDVNGDGIADFIIGARGADPNGHANAGRSYVVFGTTAGFPAEFALSSLDGTSGFSLEGLADPPPFPSGYSGASVSSAGDVNGDGIGDVIVGACGTDTGVVFGTSGARPPVFPLVALNGSNGFRLTGFGACNYDASVSGAGDVNGDGIADLIVGAYLADHDGNVRAGEAYVVFGSASGFPAALDVAALDGTNGFTFGGTAADDKVALSVSAAGDIDGDGIADLIISGYYSGEAYVVFGSQAGFPAELDRSVLNGDVGFILTGTYPRAVSSAGDVNGDGLTDLIIGRHSTETNYVVFGRNGEFPPLVDVSILDGTDGFALIGVELSWAGFAVSDAGDVNGDGIGDVIIGAPRAEPNHNGQEAGASYVVFGSDAAWPPEIDLSALDGTNGFVLKGIEQGPFGAAKSGHSVSGARDVNADGVDDVIIGAYGAEGQTGEAYVVFGCATATDGDCDSIADSTDNCLQSANRDQRDTDADGIGNACDADFNQDCMQNFSDLGIMKTNFFLAGDLATDMNGDGVTNFVDLGALKLGFFQPPGPSGIPNLCDGR